jgi:hypothetical protein
LETKYKQHLPRYHFPHLSVSIGSSHQAIIASSAKRNIRDATSEASSTRHTFS